jgi:hypothetical protein
MGMQDTPFRTLTCDGTSCTRTVTFQLSKEEHAKVLAAEGNEWLKSGRFVNTPDGRNLFYCSDVCEIEGVKTGQHNLPEPKRIITGVASAAQVAAAAAAAKAAEQATTALKAGGPVSLG